jgi:hypothetical protein
MRSARILEATEISPGRFEVTDAGSIPQAIANIRRFLKGARVAADVWNEITGEIDETLDMLRRRRPRELDRGDAPRARRSEGVPRARKL